MHAPIRMKMYSIEHFIEVCRDAVVSRPGTKKSIKLCVIVFE